LTPKFFGKKYFLVHTHTESTLELYYILKLGLGRCFCYHFNRFLDSSKWCSHDFDPPVKK